MARSSKPKWEPPTPEGIPTEQEIAEQENSMVRAAMRSRRDNWLAQAWGQGPRVILPSANNKGASSGR